MKLILEERPLAHHLNFHYLKTIIVLQNVFEVTKFHSPRQNNLWYQKNNIFGLGPKLFPKKSLILTP